MRRLPNVESPTMPRWTFGDFVLDLDGRQLLRAGTPVSLSPKALQLLGILVECHPRALSKTDLQDRLWPGTFVVEKNLTNLVSELRDGLGDDPANPRFIRTVQRFGYAFREATAVKDGESDTRARHNIPAPLTNFIGRDREIEELLRLLTSARLLTLTGAGGCGKTRLAMELAARALDRFPDGVWVVDLATLVDPSRMAQAVASVLDIREGPNRPLMDALLDCVRNRRLLLVLDNCEHLIAACAQLADALLRTAERARILATSREGLGITGETMWRVPSLSLPDVSAEASVETVFQHDAVRLFVERASAVDHTFTMTSANAGLVSDVCIRLDGIPLAIELAAARVKVLSIQQIHARLNDRFRLLTGGSRTAVARQRTLEATVDWSYGLLSNSERQLLRRLSVFAGGWTMEAAEDVTPDNSSERNDVLESLSRLVDKSLVNAESDSAGSRRYHFLETVRQYARERLVESGDAERLRDRHLAFFHELVRHAEPELTRPGQIAWMNRLQREHDNLRLALEWGLEAPGRGEQGTEISVGLCWFWLKRGYFHEGQEWLERTLAAGHAAPPALRAKALMYLGMMTFFQGDFVRTQALVEESAALGRTAGDLSVVAFSLGVSALTALERGDTEACARLATEGQEAARRSAISWIQGMSMSCLAYLAMHQGDFDRASALHEEVLELSRQQGEKWAIGITLFDLALLRVIQDRHEEARALCAEGIALNQEFGDRRGIAWCLGILSAAEAAAGRHLRAARLRGAMEGLLESVGAPIQVTYHHSIGDRSLEAMKSGLGEREFYAALAEGRALSLSRAIQFGMDVCA
jgi:predicted ATPase/DNA-binding winged helix-turn-helix (wHTH) protein